LAQAQLAVNPPVTEPKKYDQMCEAAYGPVRFRTLRCYIVTRPDNRVTRSLKANP
jgi:hypothetical protein